MMLLLRLNDVALTTINGAAYPPLVADNTLTEVLTAGNDASGLSITGLNDVALTTINGAAYPPAIPTPTDITITDDNTNAVFYPTFVSGTGTQTLKADTTTTQFSINPNTGNFNVVDTLKLTQSELAIGKTSGTSQGSNCIAIGAGAGLSQTTNAIAIGGLAGQSQTNASVAIGFRAGETQGLYGIAVGLDAGKNQLADTIAIGRNAGQGTSTAQGNNAIAIGLNAGVASQTAGSICLNASGVALNPAVAGCFINPIRADPTEQLPLQFNSTTKEVSNFSWTDLLTPTSYNPILQSAGGNLNSGNYTVRNGYYIQLGKIVWFEVRIQISAKTGLGAGSEDIRVTLPVTASSITDLTQSLNIGNITGMTTSIVSAFSNIPSGGQDFVAFPIKTAASTGTTNATVSDISTGFQIRFGGFYFTS
jgi:hypothetical protein